MPARTTSAVAIIAALSLLATAGAAAQYPERRGGFWLGFGFGYGSANKTCDGCGSGPRVDGFTASVRAGGTLNPHVRLGGAVDGWSHSVGGATETMGDVTASVYFYPRHATGLFLTGGVGFSTYRVNTFPTTSGTGWGFTAGAGYDLRVGRNVSLTPAVTYVNGTVGDVQVSGGFQPVDTGWRQNFVDFGLGVTFH
jgi:hypothetical protein